MNDLFIIRQESPERPLPECPECRGEMTTHHQFHKTSCYFQFGRLQCRVCGEWVENKDIPGHDCRERRPRPRQLFPVTETWWIYIVEYREWYAGDDGKPVWTTWRFAGPTPGLKRWYMSSGAATRAMQRLEKSRRGDDWWDHSEYRVTARETSFKRVCR